MTRQAIRCSPEAMRPQTESSSLSANVKAMPPIV